MADPFFQYVPVVTLRDLLETGKIVNGLQSRGIHAAAVGTGDTVDVVVHYHDTAQADAALIQMKRSQLDIDWSSVLIMWAERTAFPGKRYCPDS